jgi:hypothetical protein
MRPNPTPEPSGTLRPSAPLPRRCFLGAELPADSDAFVDGGVQIAGVRPDGMAAAAGLVPGDIVTTIAGLPVRDLCELGEALRRGVRSESVAIETRRHHVAVVPIEVPREPGVEYGEIEVPGARLRTLATRGERATIVLVGGIACESVESGPLAELARAWTSAGYATVRFDKRGVGDSEGGPCRDVDFATELADARAVIESVARPRIVFGHSIGGVIAAQVAAEALIVYGTPVRPWIDCLLDSTRRQLALRGASEDAIAERLAAIAQLRETGELNGRSAAYHAQLSAVDLEAAWRAVRVPVLVLRGEHDWVVDAGDQARLAELARGELVDLPRLDHVLGAHADREASLRDYGAGALDASAAEAAIAWLNRAKISA